MNDSGYDSPKLYGKTVGEEKVVFYIDLKRKDGMKDTVWAEKDEILADAIKRKNANIKIRNIIFWAKMRSRDGIIFVNPFSFSCGLIRDETEVFWKETTDKIYDNDVERSYGKVRVQQHFAFFISNSNQRHKENITHINRQKLECFSDICVVPVGGENVKETLTRDGRFKNIDRFNLNRKLECGVGSVIGLNDSPADVAGYVLEVKLGKYPVQSTNTEPKSACLDESSIASTSVGKSTSGDASTLELENSFVTPKAKKSKANFNKLAGELWGKNRLYDFPEDEDELTLQGKRDRMEECLKARAWSSLLGPDDRAPNKFDRTIKKKGKIEFSNHNVVSRPVAFSKMICNLYDSIGFLKCGHVTATCFLVSDNLIATNWHVVDEIENRRRSSTSVDYSDVFVNFDYDQGEEDTEKRYRLSPLEHEENKKSSDLDYAFLRLESSIDSKVTLGDFVRTDVPCQGKVCIIGHPAGGEKQEEICPIIPRNEDRMSLQYGSNRPENELEFYMFRDYVRRGLYNAGTALAYDVGSMFQGSSGAPVFDMRCHIVALHTHGFYIEDSMAIEAGVTFAAITRDLRANGHEEFVREHFPYCTSEEVDMETN